MGSRRLEVPRGRWVAAVVMGLAMGLGGLGWSGTVGAQGRAPRSSLHVQHRGPRLPVVGNARDLKREPVVHATKGRPPTKLEMKNLVVGKGKTAKDSSTVSVMYVGASYRTGKDFTSTTWKERHPTTFPLNEVVPGFRRGLIGMKVGGRREIVIPPKLGYGDRSTGPIKADETLVFVVDLKGVSG
ncbi:MAG: FKBP-type peptidyl-prolyl cis-trans isomerase [Acidimicrobiales bacterium]